jgi:hypothetical protein
MLILKRRRNKIYQMLPDGSWVLSKRFDTVREAEKYMESR